METLESPYKLSTLLVFECLFESLALMWLLKCDWITIVGVLSVDDMFLSKCYKNIKQKMIFIIFCGCDHRKTNDQLHAFKKKKTKQQK